MWKLIRSGVLPLLFNALTPEGEKRKSRDEQEGNYLSLMKISLYSILRKALATEVEVLPLSHSFCVLVSYSTFATNSILDFTELNLFFLMRTER